MKIKSYFILIVLFVFFCNEILSQEIDLNQHRVTNYTIEEGLPSNECHEILQDNEGYIWIATDRGLIKYDGYRFTNYGIANGLKDISCLSIQLGDEGKIWLRTYTNQIYAFDPVTEKAKLFEFQDVIEPYLEITRIYGFSLNSKGGVSVILSGIGILNIYSNGTHKLDRHKDVDTCGVAFTRDFGNNLLMVANVRGEPLDVTEKKSIDRIKIGPNNFAHKLEIYHDGKSVQYEIDESMDNSNIKAFSVSSELSFLNIYGVDYFIFSDTTIIKKRQSEIEDVNYVEGKGIFISEINQRGLKHYASISDWIENRFTQVIQSISATSMIQDKEGNYWASSLDQGIFKIQESQCRILDSNINRTITSIESNPEYLYHVVEKKELWSQDKRGNNKLILENNSRRLNSLTFDPYQKELIICQNPSYKLKHGKEDLIYYKYNRKNDTSVIGETSFLEAFILDEDEILGGHPDHFLIYSDLDSFQEYFSLGLEEITPVKGAIKKGEHQYYLGTTQGLRLFENRKVKQVPNLPNSLLVRINELIKKDDKLIAGTQGNGVVIWDYNNHIHQLDKSNGLLSNNIEHLYKDNQDRIYVCTKSGLSRIEFEPSGKIKIVNYTKSNGLPANEIYDVTQWNDKVYVATSKGIAELTAEKKVESQTRVIIEDFQSGSGSLSFPELAKVPSIPYKNPVKIQYKTLNYKLAPHINYRYRLNQGAWVLTNTTSANFNLLHEGKYIFEVETQFSDLTWSKTTSIEFSILPPWWRTWWFYILGFIILSFLTSWIFKIRTKRIRKKYEVKKELDDLERAALQAQMNPHFIFNCLNSIQNFIMQNEKAVAMEYLTQFAHLIRGNLNASTQQNITLMDEIKMLKNYLSLEKIRLGNKFDFQFKVDPELDLASIKIPPMLIQPFVENSVIHGMKSKKSNGLIILKFNKKNKQILIRVIDNGEGINNSNKSKNHLSLGMSITEKRLSHIDKNIKYQIKPRNKEHGTEVQIYIPLNVIV